MCVTFVNEWEVATEDMTAYKFVRRKSEDVFESPLPLDKRGSQYNQGVGQVLEYKLGEITHSEYPGIYLLASPIQVDEKDVETLVVTIPKGTMFRRGTTLGKTSQGHDHELRTLNALAVKPLRVWHGDALNTPNALWYVSTSTATTTATTYWNYVTASTGINQYWCASNTSI